MSFHLKVKVGPGEEGARRAGFSRGFGNVSGLGVGYGYAMGLKKGWEMFRGGGIFQFWGVQNWKMGVRKSISA